MKATNKSILVHSNQVKIQSHFYFSKFNKGTILIKFAVWGRDQQVKNSKGDC